MKFKRLMPNISTIIYKGKKSRIPWYNIYEKRLLYGYEYMYVYIYMWSRILNVVSIFICGFDLL